MFAVQNNGSATITVKGTAGATVAVSASTMSLLYFDGSNVVSVSSPSSGSGSSSPQPWDFILYYPGTYTAGQVLIRVVMADAVSLPVSLSTSPSPSCTTAPTGAVTLVIKKNGSSIGSVNFAAGATTGTFTFTSAVSLASGDTFEIDAPATVDATLAGVSITIVGTY
jgi:hypothetical protein